MIRVFKIGGNVVDNPEMLEQFASDFSGISGKKVLIHGGGVMASQLQKSMGMTPVMIEGRRVTDEDTLRIVTMVYAGWCNKHITALLQKYCCNAIGLSGADGNVIRAAKRPPIAVDGYPEPVDYGFVGDIDPENIDSGFIGRLLDMGLTPVFSAINHDGCGNLLNTNADTVASSVAIALAGCGEETELIYCFEKNGVLFDRDDENSLIRDMDRKMFLELKAEGRVAEGMIPKLSNSFKAIDKGVRSVTIKHASNILNDTGTILHK